MKLEQSVSNVKGEILTTVYDRTPLECASLCLQWSDGQRCQGFRYELKTCSLITLKDAGTTLPWNINSLLYIRGKIFRSKT